MCGYHEDDEVEDGRGDGLADEGAHELAQVVRAEAPALGVADRHIPVGGHGVTGDPGDDGKADAPEGGEHQHHAAEQAVPRPFGEDAQVLTEQGNLDTGHAEWVGCAAYE